MSACARVYVHACVSTYILTYVRACVRSNKIDVRLDEIDTYAREESHVPASRAKSSLDLAGVVRSSFKKQLGFYSHSTI